MAEIKKTPLDKVAEQYDEIEKEMLGEFFNFLKEHKSYNWLHVNMRDINYDFQAIEHRYRVLAGHPKF